MDPVIPIADLQPIYSVAAVDRALEDGTASKNDGLRSWYDRMRELGGSRYIIKPTTVAALDELYDSSPNFREVIDDLKKYLALAISGNEPVQFLPLLLLGEPGLGKTYFAKRLAAALATGFEFVPMNSLTAGWILSGASAQWTNARPGRTSRGAAEPARAHRPDLRMLPQILGRRLRRAASLRRSRADTRAGNRRTKASPDGTAGNGRFGRPEGIRFTGFPAGF